jgi:hypothetical protein
MEGGHASSACTTTWRKDISDVDILDECRVEVNPSVDCTQNAREDFLWACVFKTTALALSGVSTRKVGRKGVEKNLGHSRAHCCDNDHVIVVLCKDCCFARR